MEQLKIQYAMCHELKNQIRDEFLPHLYDMMYLLEREIKEKEYQGKRRIPEDIRAKKFYKEESNGLIFRVPGHTVYDEDLNI